MNLLSSDNLSMELTKRNISPSYQRIKILEYMIQNQCHPTVEQIFNDLIKEIPTLSKATVYNTLNAFMKAKMVRVINIENHETRYDIIMENHGHFKCECCGTIYNFHVEADKLVVDELKGFRINDKNVYFKGICPECLSNKSTA